MYDAGGIPMKMTEESFNQYTRDYAGYCIKCDDVTLDDGVEPDATRYMCPKCGTTSVCGVETALMFNRIKFVDEDE
jgi:predicted RNA-binding Zn-ribbon protein involved in translation (DUF1610 family)